MRSSFKIAPATLERRILGVNFSSISVSYFAGEIGSRLYLNTESPDLRPVLPDLGVPPRAKFKLPRPAAITESGTTRFGGKFCWLLAPPETVPPPPARSLRPAHPPPARGEPTEEPKPLEYLPAPVAALAALAIFTASRLCLCRLSKLGRPAASRACCARVVRADDGCGRRL